MLGSTNEQPARSVDRELYRHRDFRDPEVLASLRKRVPTDEACNAVEVKTTQAQWRACEESAEFSSRGMYKEVLQELVRSGNFLQGISG